MVKQPIITADDILGLLKCRHGADVFVPECKDGPTQGCRHLRMDGWAMKKSWAHPLVTAYEIKVTRSDFMGDEKWRGYLPYCNEFYFAAPPGIIDPKELPDEAGLLITSKNGSRLFKKKRAAYRDIEIPDSVFRYILFSRTRVTKECVYETPREFWAQWLEDKKDDEDLGYKVGRRLKRVISEQIEKVRTDNHDLKREIEKYTEIRELLKGLGFTPDRYVSLWDVKRKIKAAFNAVPEGLADSVQAALKRLQEFDNELTKLNAKEPTDA